MKDRQGHDYEELVGIQTRHLGVWKERLRPAIFEPVADYVRSHNAEARTTDAKHTVFRGQDLFQIIYEWPNLTLGYPPVRGPAPGDLI